MMNQHHFFLLLLLMAIATTAQASNSVPVVNGPSYTETDTVELERLYSPSMSLDWDSDHFAHITIKDYNDPPAIIYYNVNGGDWKEYSEVLVFTEEGDYIVQAYCDGITGFAPSLVCIQTFTVAFPSPVLQFMKDGIFYNVKAGNEVAVASSHPESSYSGHIEIPSTVTYQGQEYTVTSIGASAFADCTGLTAITIPEGLKTIGGYAFAGCTGLTTLTLPSSISHIDDWAFTGCSNIRSVTSLATTPPEIGYYTFEDTWVEDETLNNAVYRYATLRVPQASLVAYCKSIEWARFENISGIPDEDSAGDMNGDGFINVSDVTFLIDKILNME